MQDRKYDLEERLVDYTCRMIDVVEALPTTRAGNYISGQLVRSSTRLLLTMEKLREQNHPRTLFIKWALFLKSLKNAE